jgi:hypothetical protein
MENEIVNRRWLIVTLVTVTVVIFLGLVWLIAVFKPWNLLGLEGSTGTPDAQGLTNCTYPVSYWKAHPELYPAQLIIGGTVYKERELEALLADDSQETDQQIRVQLAVAFLNNQSGADQSSIEATIFDAFGWLVKHPTGSQVSEAELATGGQLLQVLLAYNTGSRGVAACEVVATLKTLAPAGTASMPAGTNGKITSTATLTGTPTMTGTSRNTTQSPLGTPSPTNTRTVAPSQTPTRTFSAGATFTPTMQISTPTNTTAPTFTNTPLPSFTSTPPDTPTMTPPPTPTYTPPPPPTPTYTPPPIQ